MKNIVVTLLFIFTASCLLAQNVAGFQEYFVPGPEDNLSDIWDYVYDTSYDDNFRAVVSVTATTDDTEIIYDHWEDGYSNSDASNITITLNAGDYYAFEDKTVATDDDDDSGDGVEDPEFTAGNSSTYNIDGGDRIYVTGGPVFVLRAALPHDFMSVCWELLPVQAWRTDFIMPFGTDVYTGEPTVFHDMMKVAIVIQSAADANTVTVTCPDNINTWSGDLDKGETKFFTDVRKGTTISCDTKAQVHMILGSDYGYDIRGLSGIPAFDGNGNEYWAPINVSGDTDVFFFNHNASSITMNYEDNTGSGSFQIDAGEATSFNKEVGRFLVSSGAHFYTSGSEFCAAMSVDTDSGKWDWATVLVQNSLLGTDYRIGWAPGGSDDPNTEINNCIFAIATENDTDIFVDFDGDGDIDQSYNGTASLDKLDVVLIADQNDYDTSGARIWSNDKKIALSYGEISGSNPFQGGSNTSNGSPAMDLGYTILPMPEAWIEPVIEVTASDDQGETPVTTVGENVNFTIRLDAHDYNLTSVTMSSVLDICWEYDDDSSTITHYNSSGGVKWSSTGNDADPTITGDSDPGYTLSWPLDNYDGEGNNGSVNADEYVIITFDAYPTACTLEGENEIVTETGGTYDSHEFNAYDSEFVTVDGEDGTFGDEPDPGLPVTLSEFTVAQYFNEISINWTTQSEANTYRWNIYRGETENAIEENNVIRVNDGIINAAGSSTEPINYSYVDKEIEVGKTYWYYLESIELDGYTEILDVRSITVDDAPELKTELLGNYPNPFNPTTTIKFSLREDSNVALDIYNIKGQRVASWKPEHYDSGINQIIWNGEDLNGEKASSGIYYYKLKIGNKDFTSKMLLLK